MMNDEKLLVDLLDPKYDPNPNLDPCSNPNHNSSPNKP